MTFQNSHIETTIVVRCCPIDVGDETRLSQLITQWLVSKPWGYLRSSEQRLTSESFSLDFYLCIKNRYYQDVVSSLERMIQFSILPSETTLHTQGSWLVSFKEDRQCYELIDELVSYSSILSQVVTERHPEAIASALSKQAKPVATVL